MALQIEKTFASGAAGNYWKITWCEIDMKHQKASFIIECWKDVGFRQTGAPSLMEISLEMSSLGEFPFPAQDLLTDSIYAIGYSSFKQLPYFSGALDV